jgi:tetrahedral aminopeptidase
MEVKKVLKELSEAHAPSGREHWIHPLLTELFKSYGEISIGNLNNLYVHMKGKGRRKIAVMAHADEVFLNITGISENGFLKFRSNGIDPKTLVSKEIVIHGKQDVLGIIGIKPPHIMTEEDRDKAVTAESLLIDTGLTKESLESLVKIGDFVTLKGSFAELLNNNVACKAADDRAGITALYACAEELKGLSHEFDVYLVCSAQEEVGHRGAKVASYELNPDIGIAIDTTFDSGKLGDEERENKLGEGPVICVGPNVHPKLRKKLMSIAKREDIPFQIEVEPGNTGTDAWDIQVAREGIPTLLISIPIRYMHTTVEVVNLEDIKNTGRLLAKLIEALNDRELEEILCY